MPSLVLRVLVDGELALEPSDGLRLLRPALLEHLTFPNPLWQQKVDRGVWDDDTPRVRFAWREDKGGLRLARGAWRILSDLAKEKDIQLQWLNHTIPPEEAPASFSLDADLRSYQKEAVEALKKARSGVIVIPTGGGKTIVALGLAHQLQTRTLFFVHTRELLQQTAKAARTFLGIEIGVIGSGVWEPKDFTVGLIQTMARRDLSSIADLFGLIIVDEAHHAPAASYCEILPQFRARYRAALTATPLRKDGMHELLWLHFGEIVYQIQKQTLEEGGRLLIPTIHPIATNFAFDYHDNFADMISALCRDSQRHRLLLETIQKTHRTGGCSLLLTERVEHAIQLCEDLQKNNLPAVLMHGQMSARQREVSMELLRSKTAELLVATLPLIGEGWDHPPLDTLYLTVPNGNKTKTTQALGRILRPHEGKPTPRVFDFLDGRIGILRYHWKLRGQAYRMPPDAIQEALLPFGERPRPRAIDRPTPRPEYLEMIRAIVDGDFQRATSLLPPTPPLSSTSSVVKDDPDEPS